MKILCLFAFFLSCSAIGLRAAEPNEISPELDYFPSRLHAAIFRNWDIVPHERLAAVLGTDVKTIRKTGHALGLEVPAPFTPEMIRRNVEMVLRRNWPLLPRPQIEALLGFSAKDLDEFLGKEIFLRALLVGQPDGLTPLRFETPNKKIRARADWFRAHVKKHLAAVATSPPEPRLAFTNDLCRAHDPADFVAGTKSRTGNADLREAWAMHLPENSGPLLQNASEDFLDYCKKIQHAKTIHIATSAKSRAKTFSLALEPAWIEPEKYSLEVLQNSIALRGGSERGLARGLIELERRMGERGGPFLSPCHETNQPAFSPRYVSSYFSLMTDVLGQDLIDPFPDGYLNQLAHQDADGVWVYALLQDLVPSPVFEGMGVGGEARLKRLRDFVNRADKFGLKVYIYLNEPRAQFLPFFEKYPDVKGQPEGNTAALCTSTEAVQKHLRGSFEKLFHEVPGLGGVFVITASENLANCYSHSGNTSCPRCSKRNSADVIAESIRCMAEGTWTANPKAKFIVWDWSWHAVLGENKANEIIEKLPKGVSLMADFERGTKIERGGVKMNVEEYAISVIGPSPRAKLRSQQAKQLGLDFAAKIQLSTTWECGTVPFIPVPNLLARKAAAMRDCGVKTAMETWTIGSYPSPDSEAFALTQWNPQITEQECLRRVATRRYGSSAADDAVRGWTKLSEAFTEEFPFFGSYAPPLQNAPALPLYRREIPKPYGRASLLNPKDDWRSWTPPFRPELMIKLLRHLCDRWDDGMSDLQKAVENAPAARRRLAERDLGVAWMVGYTYRAYANDLEFYMARDTKNFPVMKRIATEELKTTEEALRKVNADSRLGWEAELQYFYRPGDVMERLLSLDAIVEPMP